MLIRDGKGSPMAHYLDGIKLGQESSRGSRPHHVSTNQDDLVITTTRKYQKHGLKSEFWQRVVTGASVLNC